MAKIIYTLINGVTFTALEASQAAIDKIRRGVRERVSEKSDFWAGGKPNGSELEVFVPFHAILKIEIEE